MWYPATITAVAASEPVTAAEVKAQTEVDFADDDTLITLLIAGARAFTEKYCGTRLGTQTVSVKCDCFGDFKKFAEAPVQSITSISYVDSDGATQTLAASVYELRSDGLEVSIALKYGQVWPVTQSGSRITVIAVVGYTAVPDDVKRALLLYIAGGYANRENAKDGDWTAFDSLLCNHRRNA
jgi:uncharacterized phiE125 gp8 family phage protein